MKRVYLDQMHWVSLAAARKGLPKGERFVDALTIAEAGVEMGLLSFPLSAAHYMETANRRDWSSRFDLGSTMALLSRFHTLAPQRTLLPAEIDRSLKARFGVSADIRKSQPFGKGVNHAFALKVVGDDFFDGIGGRQSAVEDMLERALLVGAPPELESQLPGFDPRSHLHVSESFAEE